MSTGAPRLETADPTAKRFSSIYSRAYDWAAPAAAAAVGGADYQKRIRYKVRVAITTWDLQRLRPDTTPDMETEEYHPTYHEDRDLEVESPEDPTT